MADVRLAEVIAEPAALLSKEIESAALPVDRFWRHLSALSASIESNRELAQTALVKTIGRGRPAELAEPRLTACISGVEGAVLQAFPKMAEELVLRISPLREQWEARGPGLLRLTGMFTEEALIVEDASVVVVHPALGGGGDAFLPGNQARI